MKKIILFILLVIVSCETFGATKDWYVPNVDEYDSVWTYFAKNGTIVDSIKYTESVDTGYTYTANSPDTFYQIWSLVYFQGDSHPASFQWQDGGGFTDNAWRVPLYFQDSAVYCTLTVVTDGIAGTSKVRSGVYGYDTTLTVSGIHLYEARFRILNVGDDSARSVTFTRNTDTASTILVPTNPIASDSLNRCFVYGQIFTRSGEKVYRATVSARAITGSGNPVINGGDTILTITNPVDTTTDTSGFFGFALFRSNQYARDSVYYEIKAQFGGREVLFIQKVFVPDTGQLNLGNLTAQRLQ